MALDPRHRARPTGRKLASRTIWNGLPISIEVKAGDERKGKNDDGSTWTMTYKLPYGYIGKTRGLDHDQTDVFVGPTKLAPYVYGIDLLLPNGDLDEQKFFLGFLDKEDAEQSFDLHYNNPQLRKRGITHVIPFYEFAGQCADKNYWGEYMRARVLAKAESTDNDLFKSRQTPEAARRSSAKYAAKPSNKKKLRAKWKIAGKVKSGKLKKASACSKCGKKTSALELHHSSGYNSESARGRGRWMCYSCHRSVASYRKSLSSGQKNKADEVILDTQILVVPE